jgi:hypothetical protein
MTRRELGDLAPIRAALRQVEAKEAAAADLKDERLGEVLGDVRKLLVHAIADAARPPEGEGISPAEYARRMGISRWAVYKQIERGELQVIRRRNGQILLPAA